MTDNRMALLEMAEKGGDVDFLRELVREVAYELMDAEANVVQEAYTQGVIDARTPPWGISKSQASRLCVSR